MKKEEPNKHDNEDSLDFEDRVLTLLASLRHNVEKFQESSESMQREIKEFRVSIHGEEVD